LWSARGSGIPTRSPTPSPSGCRRPTPGTAWNGSARHHNLDKLYLRGGHCRIGLGDFKMTEPVILTIGGRVSASFGSDATARACLTGTSGAWQRPVLDASRADQVRLPLSSASRDALEHYLAALRPGLLASTSFYADARNRHRATHVYPLADLAYSVCFSEHQGQLFAHLRLNVFSDLGGAGVSLIDGTIVKVRKGAGAYDEEELAARAHFQRGFLTALRRHPDLGATALHPFLVST
jgi:hypothetical protein